MRMLLVQPPQGTSFGLSRILNAEPFGLEYVGGALRRQDHDAEIVDLRLDDWAALERVLDDAPTAVGISCAFTTDVYPTWEVARFVKERRALAVVVGGHHASLVPRDFIYPRSPVDAVVVGEGESTSLEVLEALGRGEACEHELTTHDYGYYDVMHSVLPTRLPLERFYERVASLYNNALKDVRPTLKMARRAMGLALGGHLWLMRKVYGAARQVRTASEYMRPPLRVRAPRSGSGRFSLPERHAALLGRADARPPTPG